MKCLVCDSIKIKMIASDKNMELWTGRDTQKLRALTVLPSGVPEFNSQQPSQRRSVALFWPAGIHGAEHCIH